MLGRFKSNCPHGKITYIYADGSEQTWIFKKGEKVPQQVQESNDIELAIEPNSDNIMLKTFFLV